MEQPLIQLERTARFPERILLYGPGGSGKTTAVGTIIAHCPDAKCWVIDTDVSFAYQRLMWTEVPFAEHQFHVFECVGWDDFKNALAHVIEHGNPELDWLVIDNVTWCWSEVQSWFSDEVHGVDIHEFMIELRKGVKGDRNEFMKVVGATTNWDIINKTYQREVNAKLHAWRGNCILIAEAQDTAKRDSDDRDLSVYSPFGLKPAGQKGLHYVMRTTILLKKNAKGKYVASTVKDQGRQDMESTPVPDPEEGGFGGMYLQEYAGWKATRRGKGGT